MTKSNNKSHRTEYDLREDYENVKAALAEATEDVKGRAGEIFYNSLENVKGKSSDIKDHVQEYVSEKPIQSIGIAVAAGFLLGYLLRK